MRFFRVVIRDPRTNEILVPNFNGQPGFTHRPFDGTLSTYTSLNAGASVFQIGGTNPAAQMVELDLPVTYFGQPDGNAQPFIKIHGVGVKEIAQAANLNGMLIDIYGGMAKGLPLADPSQAGCIVRGQIWQSYGTWIGTDQALSIYLTLQSSPTANQTTANPSTTSTTPLPVTGDTPANIVFQWRAGQPLLSPLVNTLQTAFPQYTIVGAVHSGLVWAGATATGYFRKLTELAQFINQKSLSMIAGYAPAVYTSAAPSYGGVIIYINNAGQICIADGTTQTTPRQIQFIDLVGQPTWVDRATVQCTTVLRGDISCGDFVVLPNAPGTTTPGSTSQFFNAQPGNQYSNAKSGSIFTGTFLVVRVRHVGNSRNADAAAWTTTLDLILQSKPGQVTNSLPVLYKGQQQ
ncbi:hypothetical protein R75471_05521 [Paraburkholderia domus]|nr:hypothetical protein R75471_05521 [Paraburkholderia domus]